MGFPKTTPKMTQCNVQGRTFYMLIARGNMKSPLFALDKFYGDIDKVVKHLDKYRGNKAVITLSREKLLTLKEQKGK